MIAAWLAGFALYEWLAQTQGLGFWTQLLARLHPPRGGIGASLPSFARRRSCSRSRRSSRRRPARARLDRGLRPLAVIGHLSRDVVAGAAPRIGGAPWYAGARAARARRRRGDLRQVRRRTTARASSAALAALGLPATLARGGETTSFSFSYDDGRRAHDDGRRDRRAVASGRAAGVARCGVSSGCTSRRCSAATSTRPRSSGSAPDGGCCSTRRGSCACRRSARSARRRTSTRTSCATSRSSSSPRRRRACSSATPPEALASSACRRSCSRSARAARVVIARGEAEHVPARPVVDGADPTGAGDVFSAAYLVARARTAMRPPPPPGARPHSSRALLMTRDDRRRRDGGRRLPRRRRGRGRRSAPATSSRRPSAPRVELPRVVAAAAPARPSSRVVDRRPPLAISRDGGATWREAGGGLPAGLRGRDRRGRARPDALRRTQPSLRLARRRRLLALARRSSCRTSTRRWIAAAAAEDAG